MAMDTSNIVDAMKANMTIKGLTPDSDQITDMQNLATAIMTMVQGATIVYNGLALVAPSSGGTVTEAVTSVSGLTIT